MQTPTAKSNLFMVSVSPRLERLLLREGMLRASQEEAARHLAIAAERLYTTRDYETLEELARLLAGMPAPQAKAAGAYYLALCERRRNNEVADARLLQAVVSQEAAPRYQARALQALGVIHRYAGDMREAARFYDRAIEQATGHHADLLTHVNATLARSEIISTEGDHRRALDELRAVRPAVEIVAQVHPVYAPLFANDVAYELARVGRLNEARRFACYALASPLAPRFPAWAETPREIEQEQQRKVALRSNVRDQVRPEKARARKRPPRTLFLIQKIVLKASRRRVRDRRRAFTLPEPEITLRSPSARASQRRSERLLSSCSEIGRAHV